ncbi:U32 family peptidase [Selenomonadales bacterium OttesenSCG-928-I06]|nr:U32 family peptidase [Selenomonadales bacterium OttesenSCG-928-I06]
MVELLAPAGSLESLIAAVNSGANAVYLGGKSFGARHYASNFSDEELKDAIDFAHLHNVLIYVTVNTLIDNSELPNLKEYLEYLYEIGADAIIVQDLGTAYLAQKVVPNLPLHASTQMTVHNLAGVNFLIEKGFKRVVVARELSLKDLQNITSNITTNGTPKIEVETFIHGALCISYSGQCLMSSIIGTRSGNRGRCAQPCRLPYNLVDSQNNNLLENIDVGEYLLSPKDLNTLKILPKLIKANITSFKIEGRMKRPEYVATVVDIYRRAIDNYYKNPAESYSISEEDNKNIAQIFNRDFTEAYLDERPGKDLISSRRPNNRGVYIGRIVTYDKKKKLVTLKLDEKLSIGDIIEVWVKVGGRVNIPITKILENNTEIEEAGKGQTITVPCPQNVKANDRVFKVFDNKLTTKARSFFNTSQQINPLLIKAEVSVKENEPLKIYLEDEEGFTGFAESEFKAEVARNRPLTPEIILKQIDRLGNTIFKLQDITYDIEGEIIVPISQINETRRAAVEDLIKNRLSKFKHQNSSQQKDFSIVLPLVKEETITPNPNPKLSINVDSIEKIDVALNAGVDIILFGSENFQSSSSRVEDYEKALKLVKAKNKEIIFTTPRILNFQELEEFQSELETLIKLSPDAIGASNLGVLNLLSKSSAIKIHADYPLNIYNNLTLKFLKKTGVSIFTLSPELNFSQIEELVKVASSDFQELPDLECIVEGYLEMMLSEYCVVGSYLGNCTKNKCRTENSMCQKKNYFLKDRTGAKFPIVTDENCRMHILNSKKLSLAENKYIQKFKNLGISHLRIEAKYLNLKEIEESVKLYKSLIKLKMDAKITDETDNVSKSETTRGHYFRGTI